MARTTPHVDLDTLMIRSPGAQHTITVGSPAWFCWLEEATAFTFACPDGTFTARRERASSGRGGWYWRAYQRRAGVRRRAYLGKTEKLTPARLQAVAASLASAAAPTYLPARSMAGADVPVEVDFLALPVDEPHSPSPVAALPLLTTKLTRPPVRANLVARPRLIARVASGIAGKLTLIAAPAGFGKTTLLAEWLAGRIEGRGLRTESRFTSTDSQPSVLSPRVAWLALDSGDNDPTIFLRYLIAALQTIMPDPIGMLALALIEAPQPPALTTLLTILINDMAGMRPYDERDRRFVLVLDDYHVITVPAIHEALTFLLNHLPATMHLVIASRDDPPLPLAQLRARDQLTELRATDLRFQPDEAASYLRDVMGFELNATDVAALDARTEGWIAGLQLAALAMRDRVDQPGFIATFTGSNRFIVDYLASEVLDRLPAHLRTFVLQTSILGRMCGSLCDAVTERQKAKGKRQNEHAEPALLPFAFSLLPSQRMLEELERTNLFLIPLDDERRWYRYHQLFADVLRERLGRGVPASEIAALHRRASGWFEQQRLIAEAIEHSLAAGDLARVADLIERVGMAMALDGQGVTVTTWLARLPGHLLQLRPRLALIHACVHAFHADYDAAAVHLQRAEAAVATLSDSQAALVLGEAAALHAVAASVRGTSDAVDLGRAALAQLPAQHPLCGITAAGLGFACFYAGDLAGASAAIQAGGALIGQHSPVVIRVALGALHATVCRAQGRLRDARRIAAEALERSTLNGRALPTHGGFLAHLQLALADYEQNDLDAAAAIIEQCAQLAQQYHVPLYATLAQVYQGHVQAARGDLIGALHQIEWAETTAASALLPRHRSEITGRRVLLWLRRGEMDRASAWAAQHEREVEDRPQFTAYDHDRFAYAYTLLAQGRWDAALTAAAQLLRDAEATGHGRFGIWALVLQALILQARGDITSALVPLERALALAALEGYIRRFVDEGAPMHVLLRAAAARGIMPNYVATLLAAFPETMNDERGAMKEASVIHRSSFIVQPLVEPLSARELEVLRLLAAGHDNARIAHTLVVAVSTVKSHVNHIFGKLGVQTRVEAVLRAQELHLV